MKRTHLLALATLLTTGALGACKSEPAPDKAPAPETTPEAKPAEAAPEAGKAPATATVLKSDGQPALAGEVGTPALPPAESPPASFDGRWDLSAGKSWSYSYTQRMQMGSDAEQPGTHKGDVPDQKSVVSGTLQVKVGEAGVADVVLGHTKIQQTVEIPGQKPMEREQELPARTYAGLLTAEPSSEPSEDPLVAALLSVPHKPIAVGAEERELVKMPFEADGKQLFARGELVSKLVGFVRCGEHTCAHLARSLHISDMEIPEGMQGSFDADVRAAGFTLFDVEDGSVFRHKSATRIELKAESKAPAAPASQPAVTPPAPAAPRKMHMIQDHLHELVRQ
jgi:hypothetical protein